MDEMLGAVLMINLYGFLFAICEFGTIADELTDHGFTIKHLLLALLFPITTFAMLILVGVILVIVEINQRFDSILNKPIIKKDKFK